MKESNAKAVAAASGSTLTALTMTPFDVVKMRLQTQLSVAQPPPLLFPKPPRNTCCQPSSAACVRTMSSLARPLHGNVVCLWDGGAMRTERVDGFADAVRRVVRAEGVKGLWKGAGTTLLIGVPSSTCYMLTYDHLLRVVMPTLSPSAALTPLLSGIIARTAISTLASPLELVRTNLQSTPLPSSKPHTLSSVVRSIRVLTRAQGTSSLWRGLGATLWRDVPFSGIYWATYEGLKSSLNRRGHSGAGVAFLSGSVGGSLASLVTNPFDVLKTRRQALLFTFSAAPKARTDLGGLLVQIIRSEGLGALFTGVVPRTVKIAPACGIMIGCFEGVGRFLTTEA